MAGQHQSLSGLQALHDTCIHRKFTDLVWRSLTTSNQATFSFALAIVLASPLRPLKLCPLLIVQHLGNFTRAVVYFSLFITVRSKSSFKKHPLYMNSAICGSGNRLTPNDGRKTVMNLCST